MLVHCSFNGMSTTNAPARGEGYSKEGRWPAGRCTDGAAHTAGSRFLHSSGTAFAILRAAPRICRRNSVRPILVYSLGPSCRGAFWPHANATRRSVVDVVLTHSIKITTGNALTRYASVVQATAKARTSTSACEASRTESFWQIRRTLRERRAVFYSSASKVG